MTRPTVAVCVLTATIAGGRTALTDGVPTGELPARLLRGPLARRAAQTS